MKVDLVCTKCQESRYRTRIDVDATTKLVPEILEPFGDQPPAETFKEKPTCFQCGGMLRPMPVPDSAARERVKGQPATTATDFVQETIFECGRDEDGLEATTLPNGSILIKTNKRLVILKEAV